MATPIYEEFEVRRSPTAVYWLIGLCVGVYFVQSTLVGDENMARALGYTTGDIASRSLWTVVTYMFVHGNLMHLVLNMWTLWLFGPRVERAWGASTFTWFYLWCGLGGWAFHYMFQSEGGTLVGASAAILGIAVAYASRWPDDEVYLFGVMPMKVVWLVVLMAAINIVMAIIDHGSLGGTAYAAHIGGMLAAGIYLGAPNTQSLDKFRRRIAPAPDYGDEQPRPVPKSSARPRERDQERERDRGGEADDIIAQSKAAVARARSQTPRVAQAVADKPTTALDAVLDKINSQGLGSLTTAERLLLDEWSKRLRELGEG